MKSGCPRVGDAGFPFLKCRMAGGSACADAGNFAPGSWNAAVAFRNGVPSGQRTAKIGPDAENLLLITNSGKMVDSSPTTSLAKTEPFSTANPFRMSANRCFEASSLAFRSRAGLGNGSGGGI